MLNRDHELRLVEILKEAGLGGESLQLAKVLIHIADEFPHQRRSHPIEEDGNNEMLKWGGLVVQSLGSSLEGLVGLGLFRKHCLKTAVVLVRAIMAVDRKLYSHKDVLSLLDEF